VRRFSQYTTNIAALIATLGGGGLADRKRLVRHAKVAPDSKFGFAAGFGWRGFATAAVSK
jgi:hypothetical protein